MIMLQTGEKQKINGIISTGLHCSNSFFIGMSPAPRSVVPVVLHILLCLKTGEINPSMHSETTCWISGDPLGWHQKLCNQPAHIYLTFSTNSNKNVFPCPSVSLFSRDSLNRVLRATRYKTSAQEERTPRHV